MFTPEIIIDTLADNVRKTGNPFGLKKASLNTWWKDSSLTPDGSTLLFTGLMYQLVPYIKATTKYLEKYEDTPKADYIRYGKLVPKSITNMGLNFISSKEDKTSFNTILGNIARILQSSGVSFAYKPDLDEYSGVLLYDLGDQESFIKHAKYVAKKLQDAGIRKLITVDPHTTYAVKVLYPKYTGISFEVQTYFELANLKGEGNSEEITLHDPCFYGRYLKLSDVPQNLLTNLGVSCTKLNTSGPFTSCCGGPAESMSPKLAEEVGKRRVEELAINGKKIVSMCPICLANLQKSGAEVDDLSSLLVQFV
ncbi:MAG TPA: (Fe-S)-binding protein [Desulfocapsa sulfexigens]|nr:(Fe-S)-binding protein [Desulfocapsa sulfexigens]